MGRWDYRDLGWQDQGKDTKGQARTVCGKEDHVQRTPGRKEEAAKVGREAGEAGRHGKENSRLAKGTLDVYLKSGLRADVVL